ncbi:MAG: carboxypeptidase regulatory-like domain-containing protein [Bacteroidetes bacterium]|nr:carboxypeptidase regulatory-like domain-containing protein [Bacteroidota bacterium]
MINNIKGYFILAPMCLLFTNFIFAQDITTNGSIITGKIEVRGVRDARNVVVFLENVKGDFKPPAEKPIIDQRNLIFIPHVLPVLVGTTVEYPNSDNVMHNVFSPSKTKKFNLGTYGSGIVREMTFDKPGIVTILCNVHTEMSAFIVILENPYFTLTGPKGEFTINNIPSGTYTVKTWHEKLKEQKQEITLNQDESKTINFTLTR